MFLKFVTLDFDFGDLWTFTYFMALLILILLTIFVGPYFVSPYYFKILSEDNPKLEFLFL